MGRVGNQITSPKKKNRRKGNKGRTMGPAIQAQAGNPSKGSKRLWGCPAGVLGKQ